MTSLTFSLGQQVRVKKTVNSEYSGQVGTVSVATMTADSMLLLPFSNVDTGVTFDTPYGPDRLAFHHTELEAV